MNKAAFSLRWLVVLAALSTTEIGPSAIAASPAHKGAHASGHSPYAGQEGRSVSTLSAEDITALLQGQGWGLAKPAELNGYPGPRHVLELADELQLTPEQRTSVKVSYDRMNARAQELGARYVEAEKALDEMFKSGTADTGALSERVALAEKLRAELRFTHLNAHLEVTRLLSPEQRQRYMELRGYSGDAAHRHVGHERQHTTKEPEP
jgi:Spy/CpxP family protein refolding chaperone